MIPRYTRKEIEKIWTQENKFSIWLKIECLVAEKQSIDGIIPKKAAKDIKEKASFNVQEIEKIEKDTKHDFIAFINNASSTIGENSKYFHHGLTSSDIIDTAFSVQLKNSAEIIIDEVIKLNKALKEKALKYKKTLMMGRSHGIHAEPITFGFKMATFYSEFKRNLQRLKLAKEEISICAISGPVGTYNSINPSVEKYIAKKMNLKTEKISTQIIPRDRHAHLFSVFAIIASSIERIAVEIRHLQRTEVREVEEFFSKTQKGSSAMPHKKNPVLSENLTGLSRYIRSSVVPMLENIALWHERDISHSSVERILAPDVTIGLNFALTRLTKLISNLKIYPENMKKNLNLLNGLVFSQALLLELIEKKGVDRQVAYDIVQKNSMTVWKTKENFLDVIKKDKRINGIISDSELKKLFNEKNYLKKIDYIFSKVFKV